MDVFLVAVSAGVAYLYVLYVSSYLSVYVFFPFLLPSGRGLIDLGLDFSTRSVSLISELKRRDPCVEFDGGLGYYVSVIYISYTGGPHRSLNGLCPYV